MPENALVTISRTSATMEEDYVTIEIINERGTARGCLRVRMTLSDFARTITGFSRQTAGIERYIPFKEGVEHMEAKRA